MAKRCIFLLGGARSGKSNHAQELAEKLSEKVLFVATAEALDDEMQVRINEHKKSRLTSWRTLETSAHLGNQIEQQIGDAEVVLIDCLTLLVSNLLGGEIDYEKAEKRIMAEMEQLVGCISKLDVTFIIVSNEVGMGLVPENKLGRIYRDMLGKANQIIAKHATEVYLMVAGIPMKVKEQ